MTQVQLNDPYSKGAPTSTKLKEYERAFLDFRNEIVGEDKQISNNQTTKLKEFIRQIQDIKGKVNVMRTECQGKTHKLKAEIDLLEKKLQGFQVGAKNLEMEAKYRDKIAQEEKGYFANCQKRVQIAESIDYKKLKKLQIEQRKSLANQIFKWILVAVYVQPENKFYWPNFKEQVIENVQGCEDLKQRLGKFNAYNAKQQQRVKTIKFIEAYEKIKVCSQFKNFESEVDKIYQIAKIFLESSDRGRKVKQYEKEIEDLCKANLKDDEVLAQSRKECDALTEKYRLSELYLDQLIKMQKSLQSKLQKYNKEVELAESYLTQISNITVSKLVTVEPKEEAEKRQQCECSIF